MSMAFVENESRAMTPEKQLETKRFSKEQKEALRKKGFLIYELAGQSIRSIRGSGYKIISTWEREVSEFDAFKSMKSEVAVNPKKLFLARYVKETTADRERAIEKLGQDLKINGVKAINGDIADWTELFYKHLDATGNSLFYGDYVRTSTRKDSFVALAGGFKRSIGLIVRCWYPTMDPDVVHTAAMVVPSQV
jgi:hypothetical protein